VATAEARLMPRVLTLGIALLLAAVAGLAAVTLWQV
jgi:putative membrane protein